MATAWPLATRQPFDQQAHRRDVNLQTAEEALRLLLHAAAVHATERAKLRTDRFSSQKNIGGHVKVVGKTRS